MCFGLSSWGLLAACALASEKTSQGFPAALQGTWAATAAEFQGKVLPADVVRRCRITVVDDRVIMPALNIHEGVFRVGGPGGEYRGELHAGGNPKAIDLLVKDADGEQRMLGIYAIEGKRFSICWQHDGKARPTEFKAAAVPSQMYFAFSLAERARAPFDVPPHYDSLNLKIAVGAASRRLEEADAKSILQVANALRREQGALRVEAMFVTAFRLYDLGHEDEAVRWFFAAHRRAKLFHAVLDESDTGAGRAAALKLRDDHFQFMELATTHIFALAVRDTAKLAKTLTEVCEDAEPVPDFAAAYPTVRFSPRETWDAKNKKLAAEDATRLDEMKKRWGTTPAPKAGK